MSRLLPPLAVVVCLSPTLTAADPVERELAVQAALAAADEHLAAGKPAEAVAALEARLADADGHRAYLAALRKAYTAALAGEADPARAEQLKRKLALLGGSPTVPVAATVPAAPTAEADPLPEARALFKQGKYAEAAARFAAAPATGDDAAAWTYCRVKLAADAVNRPGCEPAAASAAADDVTEALKLAPANAKLQQVGQQVLAVARLRASGGRKPTVPDSGLTVPADWQMVETASFRVRFQGDRAAAEALAAAAEARRTAIFGRWFGPPAGTWAPKCEVVLHPSADCYARMTGKPAAGTGHATVKLSNGTASERRIDLRADDPSLAEVALPRELTHVVIADLFPYTPPPKWAEVGMAVLSGPAEEVGRYTRKLPECAAAGEGFTVPALMGMADFPPAEKITGFYCGSVSLVEYLVRLKGEKAFAVFLRNGQRYGAASALQREYGLDPAALDAAWRRAAPGTARAQVP